MSKLLILSWGVLFLSCCYINNVNAQEKTAPGVPALAAQKADTVQKKRDSIPQTDLGDVVHKLLHKGKLSATKKDTITSKPVISFIPALGYTLTSGVALSLTGNMAFRTGPNARVSTITASAAFTQKSQFTMPIESNIWAANGKYVFIGDYRFYKYPQSTYGLGSSSNINNELPMDYNFLRLYETVLRHVAGNLYMGGGFDFDYHYNISERPITAATPTKGDDDQPYTLEKPSNTISSGFTLNGLLDGRNNSINPSKGYYAAVTYRDNFNFLGSSTPWSSVIVDLRKYYNFPEGSRNVLALWSYDWLVLNGNPPFLDLPATSWDPYSSTGRGYIQGRFRGAQMVYGEAEYRFAISANGLFGGVLFANAESFSAANGTRLQGVQPGFGPGVRIKLNKVSKTNVCIDYGFGRQGSKGLFVNVGELF